MSQPVRKQALATLSHQLLRKSSVLKKVAFSKSTLHAKMAVGGPYYDPDFPLPFYFPKSRTPLWHESDVDTWIEMSAIRYRKASKDAAVDCMPSLELRPNEANVQVAMPAQAPSPSDAKGSAADIPETCEALIEPEVHGISLAKRKEVRLIPKPLRYISSRDASVLSKWQRQGGLPDIADAGQTERVAELSAAQLAPLPFDR